MHQLESFESNYMNYWGFSVLESQLCSHHVLPAFLDWTASYEQLQCTNRTILTYITADSHWLGSSLET